MRIALTGPVLLRKEKLRGIADERGELAAAKHARPLAACDAESTDCLADGDDVGTLREEGVHNVVDRALARTIADADKVPVAIADDAPKYAGIHRRARDGPIVLAEGFAIRRCIACRQKEEHAATTHPLVSEQRESGCAGDRRVDQPRARPRDRPDWLQHGPLVPRVARTQFSDLPPSLLLFQRRELRNSLRPRTLR